jgi:hypothetical protein
LTAVRRPHSLQVKEMLEKKIIGVVVGSNDAEAHQKSFKEGEQVEK